MWQTDGGVKQSTCYGCPSLTKDLQTEREHKRSVSYAYTSSGLKLTTNSSYHEEDHNLMRIDYFLEDVYQWQSHNSIWCRFVCTICMFEIGVDVSVVVLTIVEHVA